LHLPHPNNDTCPAGHSFMMRAWLVLAVAAATAAGQRSAPNVSNWDTHSTGPAWQTGTLNINWTKPADWSPSR